MNILMSSMWNSPFLELVCKRQKAQLAPHEWKQFAYFRTIMSTKTTETDTVRLRLNTGFEPLLTFLNDDALPKRANPYVFAYELRAILDMFGLEPDSIPATRADMVVHDWIRTYCNTSQPWSMLRRAWSGPAREEDVGACSVSMLGHAIARNAKVCDLLLEAVREPCVDILNETVLRRLKGNVELKDKEAHLHRCIQDMVLEEAAAVERMQTDASFFR